MKGLNDMSKTKSFKRSTISWKNFRMTVNHSRSMTQSDMCCRSVANVFDLC